MLFYHTHHVFLNFVAILCCITSEAVTGRDEKRTGGRNSYQMCLDSFDVHNDKIIRTQDSREKGAIYLNVTDVDSREECLKYCCDTERCDVFIFEEKKPGSCYLFQCGPLYDFKCKFTNHANYSSAVRTNYNSQSNARVEEEIQISQQEHELKSLRKSIDSSPVEYPLTEPPVKPVTALTPKLVLTTPLPPKPACSRNQYECRSSGDCIAIYNVCDGIPQCADGSDEAADLVCPTEKPTISSSAAIQGLPPPPPPPLPPYSPLPADITKYQQMVDQRKALAPLYARGLEGNPRPWELPNLARQVISQQNLLYPAQQVEIPQLHKGFGNQRYQWDYQPPYEQNKDLYNPANSFHEQNNLNNYEQDQPRIFNHKGSSVIGESEADNGGYLDMKHPYAPHFSASNRIGPNRETWQENQAVPAPSIIPSVQQKQNSEPGKNITTTAPPCDVSHTEKEVLTEKVEMIKVAPKTEEFVHNEKVASQETAKSGALKTETPKFNHIQIKEPKEHKSVIVIEDHGREHGRKTPVAEHLQQGNEHEILKPKGAVISLALGLTVTAITAALIACRLRVVKRRGRRGHGPYAHDADYLVNGMYL